MGLNIAIIPWSEKFYGDRMFDPDNKECNRDGLMESFIQMQKEFAMNGDNLHTLDYYDIKDVDWFLFFILRWDIVRDIVRLGKSDRMVYCNSEPPCVDKMNTPEGYKNIKRVFPYILTWNDDWIDNKTIFKRNDPYVFYDNRNGAKTYSEKKLLTSISSNKSSTYPGELYSERLKAIEYCEKKIPGDFDFYGYGWNGEEHPCYKGLAETKTGVFYNYKFAICYENMTGIKGYISEKILDCFTSGIVPVYKGADDISKYVPSDCFIDFDSFSNYDEMVDFLKKMPEERYNAYLAAADSFLKSDDKKYFESIYYTKCLYRVINDHKKYKISIRGRLYLLKLKFEEKYIYSKRK